MSIKINPNVNWRQITENPVDSHVYEVMRKKLESKTEPIHGGFGGLLKMFKNKSVLDIGVAEHDLTHYANKSNWKHGIIKSVAAKCVGVDILQPMVDRLNSDGYECICIDATSDADMGKRFDFVHIGDVIEHVSDPVKLIKFAARHLSQDGRIIATTPNPYFYQYLLRVIREGALIANFEHIAWISESMAEEIAFRANVQLERIYRPVSKRKWVACIQKLNLGIMSDKYYYLFSNLRDQD